MLLGLLCTFIKSNALEVSFQERHLTNVTDVCGDLVTLEKFRECYCKPSKTIEIITSNRPQLLVKSFSNVVPVFCINMLSLILVGVMVPPWLRMKSKRKFPNNLMLHFFVALIISHTNFNLAVFSGFNFESWRNNVGCKIQTFFIYLSVLMYVNTVTCIAFNLYLMLVKDTSPTIAKKHYKKYVAFIYGGPPAFALCGSMIGKSDVYGWYCSPADPLWTRLFFYLPLQIACFVCVGFMIPVITKLFKVWKVYQVFDKSFYTGTVSLILPYILI